MPRYGASDPNILKIEVGNTIKEFPINVHQVLGKNVVFSGDVFLRFFPYHVIKKWAQESPNSMTNFHPREFDPKLLKMENLPLKRKLNTYINGWQLHEMAKADDRL